jgi:hypothetical protein
MRTSKAIFPRNRRKVMSQAKAKPIGSDSRVAVNATFIDR